MNDKSNKWRENLENQRKQSGLVQQELADALNISQNSIHYWEKGERKTEPGIDHLIKIADFFAITVDELLRGDLSDEDESMPYGNDEDWAKHFYEKIFIIKGLENRSNNHFDKGCQYALSALNYSLNDSISKLLQTIENAINEFKSAILDCKNDEENQTVYDSFSNIVSLSLFQCYLSLLRSPIEKYSDNWENVTLKEQKKRMLYIKKEFFTRNDEQIQALHILDKRFITCLSYLRKRTEYADLAYFFIAAKYILGCIGDSQSVEADIEFGLDLMFMYSQINNIYARNLMQFLFEPFLK